jgi:acetoin utilization deacetylase AcuC-like enzyme
LQTLGLLNRCQILPERHVTLEDLLLVHDMYYIEQLALTSTMDDGVCARTPPTHHICAASLRAFSGQYEHVFFNQHSYISARQSVGCTLAAVDSVIKGLVCILQTHRGPHTRTGTECICALPTAWSSCVA